MNAWRALVYTVTSLVLGGFFLLGISLWWTNVNLLQSIGVMCGIVSAMFGSFIFGMYAGLYDYIDRTEGGKE